MKAKKRVESLTREEFDEWLENPWSEVYFGYLKDRALMIGQTHGERLIAGGVPDQETLIRNSEQCVTMNQMTEITFDDIEEFYADDDDDDERESDNNES